MSLFFFVDVVDMFRDLEDFQIINGNGILIPSNDYPNRP